MKTEDTNYVVVFRTGKPEELDMAKEALAEANIPYYAQHETFVGLIEAMPKVPLSWPNRGQKDGTPPEHEPPYRRN
jgi:hypothetical protein